MKTKKKCPICHSISSTSAIRLYDDRYGFPGKYDILECSQCHHHYLSKSFSEAELSDLYTGRYPQSSNYKNFKPYSEKKGFFAWLNGEHSEAFRYVPKKVRVLDIGCGLGETLGYHQKRGCEAHGIDVDNNLEKIAKKYHYSVKVGSFEKAKYPANYFDYITLDQVIEHIADPKSFLTKAKRILKPGGKIIISTPNFDSWSCNWLGKYSFLWHVPYHLQFFTLDSMKKLGNEIDLELLESKTVTNSEWTFYQFSHALTFPRQGENSEFFDYPRTQRSLISKVKISFVFIFHVLHITHFFTRLVDTVGRGDNTIYFFTKA